MGKYKVALISDWYYPRIGGIEYAIDSLARHLKALGHDVHVIARRFGGAPTSETVGGIPIVRFEGSPISEYLLNPRTYKTLYQTIASGEFDVIHAHGLDSPMAMTSLVIAKRIGIPRIITSHSLFGNTPWKAPMMTGAKLFVKSANAIIAVSTAGEREARKIASGGVFRIPNGIDMQSPNGEMDPIAVARDGRTVIATVSRMTKRKGVEDIVKMAAELVKRRQDLLFLMVGGGPLQEKLMRTVADLGMSRCFLFTGNVSRATVLHLLEQADVFVLASSREAFGISVLEAFLKKVPVVAMNGTGVSDIITHGRTGLLAEDRKGMTRYVEDLIERPELRESLSMAAYDELHKYRWPAIAQQVERVYSAVVHENSRHLH